MIWSPHDIEVLLHHYCSSAPWPRAEAPAYRDSILRMTQDDLIGASDIDAGIAVTTDRAAALVRMWCEQPVPIMKFVDPRFEEKQP